MNGGRCRALSAKPPSVTLGEVAKLWWPLAASWLMMGLEGPAITAVVARLVDPEVHLAAYGGLVFPLALFIEAPIIMLLAASTTLSRDQQAYRKLRRYTHTLSASLTLLHVLIAFTPLYYLVARGAIGAPEAIVEPGRLGLMIMLPWTWSIGFRRFNQGVLIRCGHSMSVGVGTGIRLVANFGTLAIGYRLGLPGIVVAATATAAGVMAEALFVGIRVRPLIHGKLPQEVRGAPLVFRDFLRFYLPLSLTPLIFLLSRPIGSAAISRMPDPIDALAVWPVLTGVVFLVRSAGMAYNEVAVAMLDRQGSWPAIKRFAWLLSLLSSVLIVVLAFTPSGRLWMERVAGLSPRLAALGADGLWLALLLPALTVLQNWLQGVVLYSRRTRAITEAVGLFFLFNVAILLGGVLWAGVSGLFVALVAMTLGELVRTAWLAYRSRSVRSELHIRDS